MGRIAFIADAGTRFDPLAGHGAAEVARRNACLGIVAHALNFSGLQFGINVEDSRRWIAVADILHKPHRSTHTHTGFAKRFQVQVLRPRKLGDGISHSFSSESIMSLPHRAPGPRWPVNGLPLLLNNEGRPGERPFPARLMWRLEVDVHAELHRSGRAQVEHAGARAYAIGDSRSRGGSVDRSWSSGQAAGQRVWRQIEVCHVEHVEEAGAGLEGDDMRVRFQL